MVIKIEFPPLSPSRLQYFPFFENVRLHELDFLIQNKDQDNISLVKSRLNVPRRYIPYYPALSFKMQIVI